MKSKDLDKMTDIVEGAIAQETGKQMDAPAVDVPPVSKSPGSAPRLGGTKNGPVGRK
mgnify:CR=1 FL=1